MSFHKIAPVKKTHKAAPAAERADRCAPKKDAPKKRPVSRDGR